MSEITLKVPRELLLEIISCIPQKYLEGLLKQRGTKGTKEGRLKPVRIDAHELDKLTGLISIGGDALKDTEATYEQG